MTARPFLETILVCAFISGACLTAGHYADNEGFKDVGWFFLMIFFGIAVAGGLQLRREMKRQRRYERSKKGLR